MFEFAIQSPLRIRLRVGRWHLRTWRYPVMRLPRGYREPEEIYTVEWLDGEGRSLGQAGGFFSLQAAEACLSELAAGAGSGELFINTIVVHDRLEDWRWDR
ncbi:hypothetical protein DJ010_11765 [Nocardioides silvaticus]|uniref:Uncharacterized protein n=1 Tax=Nocardioides silvaticus TaxID=2201891 RepID=A0A316TGW9_9ACTN|nr:hypothetical protein [Nocardioides silvaticus]PWN03038.1 hypothetical protein DJ010_11765 [Nocardioides silvaticus]